MNCKYNVNTNTYIVELGYGCVHELTSAEFDKLYSAFILAYAEGLERKSGSGL